MVKTDFTLRIADVDKFENVRMVQRLQDLDLPEGCDGELMKS